MSEIPPAQRTAERYMELLGDLRFEEMAELFAPDAVFLAPTGDTVLGRDAIRAFYAAAAPKLGKLRSWIHSSVTEGNTCVIELAAQLEDDDPDGPPRVVVDHFTVDDAGLVSRLAVYLRAAEMENAQRVFGR